MHTSFEQGASLPLYFNRQHEREVLVALLSYSSSKGR